ncbi:hypothetical protein BDP81DRAFT_396540 [Colletotrichum phormii]|uniref:Uncharacterized protein n=1 Tax=Colletotrichum phormii TaxID=359342 RepID=A0AAI9ZKR4_9PEZI|nr:uncharacterized protein BDP81DRAFT_396540 [Colletotrichum phormii]KAK1633796.1 hypothetical protein BDP81DRAFT_396540 [Colletotrichum phormii]
MAAWVLAAGRKFGRPSQGSSQIVAGRIIDSHPCAFLETQSARPETATSTSTSFLSTFSWVRTTAGMELDGSMDLYTLRGAEIIPIQKTSPDSETTSAHFTRPVSALRKPQRFDNAAQGGHCRRAHRVAGQNTAAKPAKKPAPKSRKRKSDAATDEIQLPGDEDMSVAVWDTCDIVRTKIRAILKEGVTKTAFLRAIKGPASGNTSSVFYAAYVFFEKLRVRDGKPKTKKREEMEEEWPTGMDTKQQLDGWVTCLAGEKPHIDKYGKTRFH